MTNERPESLTQLDLQAIASNLVFQAVESITALDIAEYGDRELTDREIDMIADVVEAAWVTVEFEPEDLPEVDCA